MSKIVIFSSKMKETLEIQSLPNILLAIISPIPISEESVDIYNVHCQETNVNCCGYSGVMTPTP
jgi:hypothetical protein